jgi:hypothetical protein
MQDVNVPLNLPDRSEGRFRALRFRWVFVLASIAIGFVRLIFKPALRREPDNSNTSANPFAKISVPPTLIPEAARRYGVAVNDIVDISAMTPPMALHRATVTAIDNDRLTVRAGENIFTVRWENLIYLNNTSATK